MDDEVVELDVPWPPDPVGPEPSLYQTEGRATLAYSTSPLARGGPFAVVTFSPCLVTKFGYPNDDGRFGHPLPDLHGGWYEVMNPSWLASRRSKACDSPLNSSFAIFPSLF